MIEICIGIEERSWANNKSTKNNMDKQHSNDEDVEDENQLMPGACDWTKNLRMLDLKAISDSVERKLAYELRVGAVRHLVSTSATYRRLHSI